MPISELQNLPKSWQVKTLGEIYDITSSKRVFKSEWQKTGIPFYRARDLVSFSKNETIKNPLFISETMYNEYSNKYGIPLENDILVTGVGTIGIPYLVKANDKFYFKDGNILWLKKKTNDIFSKYVYYLFFSNLLNTNSKGSTVLTYTIINAKNTKIPLPPLDIQKRIVARLDEAFARIDSGTNHLKSAQKNLTKYKQSLLKSAFNGTLTENLGLKSTHFTHPLAPSAREGEQEAIHTQKAPPLAGGVGVGYSHTNDKKDCHDWLAQNLAMTDKESSNLPQGWTIKTLGEVLSSDKHAMKRGPFGSSLKKEFFVDSGIRVFEQYNPINQDSEWKRYFITQEKFKELESFKAGAGDLLVSCSGTLGKILELPQNVEIGIINQALLKIRLDNKQILNKYFVHLFNSPNMQRIILENTIGSTIQNIASVKILKQIKIPLPPLKTQKQIVEILEKHFSSADKTSAILDSTLKNAKQLKSSLLKSAFMGKLI
ncbi:restriction endonuclease subunit S [Helicobacter sp. 23-1044]